MTDFESTRRRIARLRQDEAPDPLRRTDLAADPLVEFAAWFQLALDADLGLPQAMALATATPAGRPSVRMVLLKGFDARGFEFYTDADSRKGRELAANPRAAAVLYWRELNRQVRIEGEIEPLSRAETRDYFDSRPYENRLAAWASRQSAVVRDRTSLKAAMDRLRAEYAGREVELPPPPSWSGYRLVPAEYEFWQQGPHRLHDRFRYRPAGEGWAVERLSP